MSSIDGFDMIDHPVEADRLDEGELKHDVFKRGIAQEVGLDKSHVLNAIMSFDGRLPGPVDITANSRTYRRAMLQNAAYEFYQVFDAKRYQDALDAFSEPGENQCDIITRCVWYRYRRTKSATYEWRRSHMESTFRNKRVERTTHSKQPNESVNNNKDVSNDKGHNKCCAICSNTVPSMNTHEAALALERRFLAWLTSDEYITWSRPMIDSSKVTFAVCPDVSPTTITNFRAPDIDDILERIADRPDAGFLIVSAVYKWDQDYDTQPDAYCVDGSTLLRIITDRRMCSMQAARVTGIETCKPGSNRTYPMVTTSDTMPVRRSYPAQFEQFEHRDDSTAVPMRVCRRYKDYIHALHITHKNTAVGVVITRDIGGIPQCDLVMNTLDDIMKTKAVRKTEDAIRRLEEMCRWR